MTPEFYDFKRGEPHCFYLNQKLIVYSGPDTGFFYHTRKYLVGTGMNHYQTMPSGRQYLREFSV